VAGLGIAVGTGAVRVPLAASTAKAPRSAASVPALVQFTVSASRYLYVPATVRPRHVVRRPESSAPATPPVTATPQVTAVPPVTATPSVTAAPSPRATASEKAKPKVHPTKTPTAARSSPQPAASPVLVPTPTAEDQTPTGLNELAWSEAILRGFGDPLTTANIISMGYWMQNEAGHPPYGIVGANNPINVSEPGYGGTAIQSEGGGYYLYSYPTVQDGIEAIVAYLNRPNYVGILAALQAGVGLSSPSLASEFYVYSGGGYTSVPDSWGASQGQPET
jgi:hypothetical protein